MENKAQATQIPPPPTEVLKPQRAPSRTLFILGAIGTLISGTAFIWSFYGPSLIFIQILPELSWEALLIFPSIILVGIGLILASMGYLGFKRNYGVGTGLAGFAFGIVAGVFLPLFIALAAALHFPDSHDWGYPIYVSSAIISLLLLGVAQILWGVTHIKSKQYTGDSGLAKATGVMFIISGALAMSIILCTLSFMLFFVSDVLALYVFLTSKIPQQTQPA